MFDETNLERKRLKARERQWKWKERQNLSYISEKHSNEEKTYKRPRSINWTEREKHFLIDCLKDHIKIVENVQCSSNINRKKKIVWENVLQQFINNGFDRDIHRIKQQWQRLKSHAKLVYSTYKQKLEQTTNDINDTVEKPNEIDFILWNLLPADSFTHIDNNTSDSDSGVYEKRPKIRNEQSSDHDESDISWSLLDSEDQNSSNVPDVYFQNTSDQKLINDDISEQIEIVKTELNEESPEELQSENDESLMYSNETVDLENVTGVAVSINNTNKEIPFITQLPPLHPIIQEPVIHPPLSTLENCELNDVDQNMIDKTIENTNSDNADIIELKKQLLLANIERVEVQKKLDLELHELKMKNEALLMETKRKHLEYLHKLKITLEKRYYKQKLETLV